MTVILECSELEKTYRNRTRIGPFSFSVSTGEVVGLIGENGAGKTTLLELVAGLRKPTWGTAVRRLGADGARLGYLPHRLNIYDWMRGFDALDFVSGFYRCWDQRYAVTLAERLNLDLGVRFSELSRGNQTKLGLICALAHLPPLLLLDEPTAGLDPIVKRDFSVVISEYVGERSCAVILSSHVFEDLQRLSTRYMLIKSGRIVGDARAAEIGGGASEWFWSHYPAN